MICFESLVTYVGMPTLLPKQSMQISWLCLDRQIGLDHLQLIVRTVSLKRSDLRKSQICLKSEYSL